MSKSLITHLGEAIDRYHTERRAKESEQVSRGSSWLYWLGRQMVPNIGTLLLVIVLLFTVPSLAAPSRTPSATSTSTISYQGRLADSGGTPITGKQNMEFRLYDAPTGGVPLWTEMWTGGNAVDVSDGLFNVMLGSIDATLASAIEGHDELYLGITVGTDSEMEPLVQLGSVPFSMQAMTVPDGSITEGKIADDAVISSKIASGAVGSDEVEDNSLTANDLSSDSVGSDEIANGIVTQEKLADPITKQTFSNYCLTFNASYCDYAVSNYEDTLYGQNRLLSWTIPFTPFVHEMISVVGRLRIADNSQTIGYVPIAVRVSGSDLHCSAIVPGAYFNTVNSRVSLAVYGY